MLLKAQSHRYHRAVASSMKLLKNMTTSNVEKSVVVSSPLSVTVTVVRG